jgi:spore maturation protein CgeB
MRVQQKCVLKKKYENMKVIIVSMFHYPFGDRNGIATWEYYNIYQPIEQLKVQVIPFDFMVEMKENGLDGMNEMLVQLANEEQPDLIFFTLYTEQFKPETIDLLSRKTLTLAYLFDDPWRIQYSRFWAKHFTYITSSDVNGMRNLRDADCRNVIHVPFGSNHYVLGRKDLPKIYDVTFVGGYHPQREWYLNAIKKAGINVRIWGPGWRTTVLDQIQMAEVFRQSRINLNLSNCVTWDIRCLLSECTNLRALRRIMIEYRKAFSGKDPKIREMIKFRQYEINACGGFQISYYAEGLERHYEIGDEIAIFLSLEDLIEKIQYYLKHEDERENIAKRGYVRTLKEHTMEKRFMDLFDKILPDWRKAEK